MALASEVLRSLGDRIEHALEDLIHEVMPEEFSKVAAEMYQKQYERKTNPYEQPWEPSKYDSMRRGRWKFGKVKEVGRWGFSLIVAAPNVKRSCVPFEPRGLGTWEQPFRAAISRSLPGDLKGLK